MHSQRLQNIIQDLIVFVYWVAVSISILSVGVRPEWRLRGHILAPLLLVGFILLPVVNAIVGKVLSYVWKIGAPQEFTESGVWTLEHSELTFGGGRGVTVVLKKSPSAKEFEFVFESEKYSEPAGSSGLVTAEVSIA